MKVIPNGMKKLTWLPIALGSSLIGAAIIALVNYVLKKK